MGDRGLEITAKSPADIACGGEAYAQAYALSSDLQIVVESWPKLSEKTRTRIVALVAQ